MCGYGVEYSAGATGGVDGPGAGSTTGVCPDAGGDVGSLEPPPQPDIAIAAHTTMLRKHRVPLLNDCLSVALSLLSRSAISVAPSIQNSSQPPDQTMSQPLCRNCARRAHEEHCALAVAGQVVPFNGAVC